MLQILEISSLLFHTVSLVLGLYLVKKHEDIFTREFTPKKTRFCIDFIEGVYLVVVLLMIMNFWFIYNQTVWIVKDYDKDLKPMVYLQWMRYHTGTGIVVSLLHLVIHWLLNTYKKCKQQHR